MIGSVCSRGAHILELYTLRVCLYTVYNLVSQNKAVGTKKCGVFTVLGYKLF